MILGYFDSRRYTETAKKPNNSSDPDYDAHGGGYFGVCPECKTIKGNLSGPSSANSTMCPNTQWHQAQGESYPYTNMQPTDDPDLLPVYKSIASGEDPQKSKIYINNFSTTGVKVGINPFIANDDAYKSNGVWDVKESWDHVLIDQQLKFYDSPSLNTSKYHMWEKQNDYFVITVDDGVTVFKTECRGDRYYSDFRLLPNTPAGNNFRIQRPTTVTIKIEKR